jgi:hypothetical protein
MRGAPRCGRCRRTRHGGAHARCDGTTRADRRALADHFAYSMAGLARLTVAEPDPVVIGQGFNVLIATP